jgi:phosphoribosylaminoimidazole carboxylase PurE protein
LNNSPLNGLDALLATVQMPGGVPVAAMAVGRAGAWNAGVLAARILAAGDRQIAGRLRDYKARLSSDVRKKARDLKKKTIKKKKP